VSNQIFCSAFIIVWLFYLGLCLCFIGFPSPAVTFSRWRQKLVQRMRLILDRPGGVKDSD
jgi:hypothetical protein